MTTRKTWRRSLGERGLRVCMFERVPGGNLYREVHVGGKRVGSKRSLGHRDKHRAEAGAYELLARLKTHKDALEDGRLSLRQLFDNYTVSASHLAKKPRTKKEDGAKLDRVIQFLGSSREVRSLCPDDVEAYRQARMKGTSGVRARTVAADLVALKTAINWAMGHRDRRGRTLLTIDPLRGAKLPKEKNPRRPVETYDRYQKLMKVARVVDWRLPLLLALLESTGQRVGSLLALERRDIDLNRGPNGWIRFRASAQKTGHAHEVPITEGVRVLLLEHIERLAPGHQGPLFPARTGMTRSVSVWVMDKRLRQCYKKAEVDLPEGGLFHAWRRKWATERKGMPLADVAAAGGWKDTKSLLTSYMHSDPDTVLQVQLAAPKLIQDAAGVRRVTPKVTPADPDL